MRKKAEPYLEPIRTSTLVLFFTKMVNGLKDIENDTDVMNFNDNFRSSPLKRGVLKKRCSEKIQ